MTEKEKAREILEKYLTIFEVFGMRTMFNKRSYDKAIKCALIAIDEILDTYLLMVGTDVNGEFYIDSVTPKAYWEKVKEEIKSM